MTARASYPLVTNSFGAPPFWALWHGSESPAALSAETPLFLIDTVSKGTKAEKEAIDKGFLAHFNQASVRLTRTRRLNTFDIRGDRTAGAQARLAGRRKVQMWEGEFSDMHLRNRGCRLSVRPRMAGRRRPPRAAGLMQGTQSLLATREKKKCGIGPGRLTPSPMWQFHFWRIAPAVMVVIIVQAGRGIAVSVLMMVCWGSSERV